MKPAMLLGGSVALSLIAIAMIGIYLSFDDPLPPSALFSPVARRETVIVRETVAVTVTPSTRPTRGPTATVIAPPPTATTTPAFHPEKQTSSRNDLT